MKQRVRVQKEAAPAAEAAATNRLTDITVNEVSIVDRAANQRKYLIVKDAPPPAAVAPPPPAVAPPVAPPAPPQLKISPELKAKIAGVLTAAQAKITEIAKALQTAAETPGAPAPQELIDALTGLSGMFAANPAAPPAAAPPAAHPAPPPAAKEETSKAGKKISAARLLQLMNAKEAIDTIIAEVSDATDDDAAAVEPAKTEKATAAKDEGGVGVTEVTPATSELDGIKASLESLAGLVGKMTQVFEGQNQRIDALAKARGESKQLDLEKAGNGPPKDKPVVWDMDMARPLKVVQ